ILAFATDAKDDSADKDLKKLQGTWEAVSVRVDGADVPADDVKDSGITMTFDKDKYSYKAAKSGNTETGTVKLDPGKKPATMDIAIGDGDDKGKTQLAIYKVEGDKLTLCFTDPGKERPTEFAAKKDSGHQLVVFKKAKP